MTVSATNRHGCYNFIMSKQKTTGKAADKKLKYFGRLVFTGLSMGTADVVPGVSGGTIALLYGIYDELLYSIKIVTGQALRLILKRKIKEALNLVPFGFLLPLLLGILGAIFGLAAIVTYLLDTHPVYVWSLFFGLVISSANVISRRIHKWSAGRYVCLGLGIITAYILVGLPAAQAQASGLSMAITGAVAICAMILPGISGSLIMVIMGQYENVLDAVQTFSVNLLAPFAIGAVTGLALFSRVLTWLLREHHSYTLAFLVGVILGSLRRVWPWQTELAGHTTAPYTPNVSWSLVAAIALAIVGFGLVWRLEKIGLAREHKDIDDKDFKREVVTQHG